MDTHGHHGHHSIALSWIHRRTAEMVSQNLISFECYFKHLWVVIIRIPTANGGKLKEMKDRIAIVSLEREQNHFKTTLNCVRKEFI